MIPTDNEKLEPIQVVPVVDESFDLTSSLYSLADSDLVDLPSGAKSTIHEMTGNEQRSFMNRTRQLSGVAIQELLGACVDTINDQPLPLNPVERNKYFLEMLSGDRATLVFQIRRHSLGNDFRFSAKCPNPECKQEDSWEVDLSSKEDFPVKPYKLGQEKTVEYESKVRPGLKIKFCHLTGNAEMTILRKRNTLNALTDLELRTPQAYDIKTQRWVSIMLNKLPEPIIKELRQTIRDYEGEIRTTVDIVCRSCEETVSFNLLEQQDFMIPSATS